MSVKKCSIDLWGTLIKSSPLFSEEKYKLVKEYFPTVDQPYAEEVFRLVKKEFNTIIESTGYQPTEFVLYSRLFYLLNGGLGRLKDVRNFIEEYNELALKFHPILFSDETLPGIEKLSKTCELTVSSNTMFIRGSVLEKTLKKLGLKSFFTNFNFSDQLKVSKPDSAMYFCRTSYSDFHIGDNQITDRIGPELIGSKAIIINSNKKTLNDAVDLIIQGR